jgi:hypothetical protein
MSVRAAAGKKEKEKDTHVRPACVRYVRKDLFPVGMDIPSETSDALHYAPVDPKPFSPRSETGSSSTTFTTNGHSEGDAS